MSSLAKLSGMSLIYDKRVKVGNLVIDKRTLRCYRINKKSLPLLKKAIQDASIRASLASSNTTRVGDYYSAKILYEGVNRIAGIA